MFGNKKDRQVVEIIIEYNITAIGQWLESGVGIQDIPNLGRNWEDADWRDAAIQRYVIDMFPIGSESNAYFHRSKGLISQNVAGIDYLENAFIVEKEVKVGRLAWGIWQGRFSLSAEGGEKGGLILLTPPLTEVAELERTGRVPRHEKESTDPRKAMTEEVEMDVPYSFDDNSNPKEFMKIWRSGYRDSLRYGNALGRVSFSTSTREVEY